MNDLISRNELLKEVEKYKFGAISNDAEREYIKKTILDFIICQPTAYSVENVVEELEEMRNIDSCKSVKCSEQPYADCGECMKNLLINKAIEIVKQGCNQ